MNRTATIFFASLILASGCGSTPQSETGSTSSPIINGVPSTDVDDAAVGIAIMSGGSFAGFCSGVLVAENVVLTARHCISKTDEGAACTKDGKPVSGGKVYSDHKAEDLQILIGAKAKFTFDAKGIKILHPDVSTLCNADIGIIILDHKLTGAKLAPIRLDTPAVKDDTILAVGWGQSNNSSGYGRRRRADIPIIAVGPASGSSLGGAVGPAEFAIGEGICSGDSGGPALDTKTGAVVGVVSRGTNGAPYVPGTDPPTTLCVDTTEYKTHNIYTRTDGFRDLILAAFAEAGAEPWMEGGPDPRKAKFGDPCDGPDACRSAMCIDAGGKRFCSDKCTADSPCPEGYTCTPAGDISVCAPTPPPTTNPATPTETGGKGGCDIGHEGSDSGSSFGLVGLAMMALAMRRRSGPKP